LRRKKGNSLGPLEGIPILLKDNIESKDKMPTTGGSYALVDNFTYRDAPLVAGLREQGAIIIGKANLSQWANFRSNESLSGWSALGGQVKNPHILNRNPCGSSSGSAVAVAASLVTAAIGTETNGSIICPATINGVVGFKPSIGLVSQEYIIPISHSQDTAGPLTKSVMGSAILLNAIDNTDVNYLDLLDESSLEGLRIGVLRFAQGNNEDIIQRFERSIEDIKMKGAKIIEIQDFKFSDDDIWTHTFNLLKYEFKFGINKYLSELPNDSKVKVKTLADIIEFNQKHEREISLFDQDILEASNELTDLKHEDYLLARTAIEKNIKQGLHALFIQNDVDILVAPSGPLPGQIDPVHGDLWPEWVGAGYLPAIAGYPHLSVPMGVIDGLPIGLSFYGMKNNDAQVLSVGYAYEQATQRRIKPQYIPSTAERKELKEAMAAPKGIN